ncbi:hypothetical protein [Paraglaciecola sp. 2405UD69-4]|uniref:hypothetical protein n=1 Tax=Paraglaciecola sp. 2405UD69-4 TaxID=3391836 RepID=UPI0039C9E20C
MTAQGSEAASARVKEQHSDAAPQDILSSWEKVFKGYLVKARLAKDLVAADLSLSVEAVIVSALCLMTLVGIGLLVWITVLLAIGYGLVALGAHWVFIPVTIIACNGVLLVCVYSIFSKAKSSINLNATLRVLFDKKQSHKE